jgi:hypothetical protein
VTIESPESPYYPANTNFNVTFHDGTVSRHWDMSLGVAGNFVGFGLYGNHNPFLVEWIRPDAYLSFSGASQGVSVAPGGSGITTSFDGTIDYCRAPQAAGIDIEASCRGRVDRCQAQNHRLMLTRR